MLALVVLEAQAAAGMTVHGRLDGAGADASAAVELVRIERCPVGSATFLVTAGRIAANGSFALAVPEDAPPEVRGRDCGLRYALRATANGEELLAPLGIAAS